MAFATVVNQISAALFQPIHGRWGPRAVVQQALPSCAASCFDAHRGIDRETAVVGISGHVFGVTGSCVAACHKGVQDVNWRLTEHFVTSTLRQAAHYTNAVQALTEFPKEAGIASAALGEQFPKTGKASSGDMEPGCARMDLRFTQH